MDKYQKLFARLTRLFSSTEGLNDLLDMCEHPNGYKRENAVRRLGMLGSPLAIPNLIVRANDWVPQVRTAARNALYKLLSNENSEAFTLSVPALYHLKQCGRDEHGDLINEVEQFLIRDKNAGKLVDGIDHQDVNVARHCARLVIDHELLPFEHITTRCLENNDIVVRLSGAGLLCRLENRSFDLAVNIAITDPLMPIRRTAFQLILARQVGGELDLAKRFFYLIAMPRFEKSR